MTGNELIVLDGVEVRQRAMYIVFVDWVVHSYGVGVIADRVDEGRGSGGLQQLGDRWLGNDITCAIGARTFRGWILCYE